jgi:hypothetical protein
MGAHSPSRASARHAALLVLALLYVLAIMAMADPVAAQRRSGADQPWWGYAGPCGAARLTCPDRMLVH